MADSLEQAWRLALAASADDVSPWRALGDLLLGEGDVRGELMQLQLAAELAPLEGSAREREQAILTEHGVALVPPGVSVRQATFARGVVVDSALRAASARDPESPLWRTVRRLRFTADAGPREVPDWKATPLGGGQLWSLEALHGVEAEALPVLAGAPAKPRLRLVGFNDDTGYAIDPPHPWRAWWASAMAKLPALEEVDFGRARAATAADGRLDALARTRVARVRQDAAGGDLPALHRWYVDARPSFAFVVRLLDVALGASVELSADRVRLRAPRWQLDQAEEELRGAWPALPPLEREADAPPSTTAPGTTCPRCGDLPDSLTVNTGRDERHLPAFYRLQRLWRRDSTASTDALRCPACGAWFEWTDLPQFYGSGNNDEERLERLSPAAAATFERLLTEELGDDAPALFDAASAQLSSSVRDTVFGQLLHARPESFERRLLGPLVQRFLRPGNRDAEDHALYGLLYAFHQRNAESSKRLAALLRAHPAPLTGRAKYLLELCGKE